MLDCSEVGIEVLDIGMKSVRFSEYREVLRVDRVANSVLATTHNKPWFFCKDRWKIIDPCI